MRPLDAAVRTAPNYQTDDADAEFANSRLHAAAASFSTLYITGVHARYIHCTWCARATPGSSDWNR